MLYLPGDDATWGGGVAVERTERALAWLGQVFGPFALAADHESPSYRGRRDRVPDDDDERLRDQGLIVHEAGHNYTMGILANNEWREAWLDEGFTIFLTSWFWEAMGGPTYSRDRGGRASNSSSTATRSRRAW